MASDPRVHLVMDYTSAVECQATTVYKTWFNAGGGAGYATDVERLKALDIKVLRDTSERLVLNETGEHLFIIGIEGTHLSRAKLNWFLKDIPPNSAVIMLSHYPDILEKHADALAINLQESEGAGVSGWRWQDNSGSGKCSDWNE